MIDRAACAGIAIGVGACLIVSQLLVFTPQWGMITVGIVLVVVGAVWWGDLREESFEEGIYDQREEADHA